MYPGGCNGKQSSFHRPADLERHYQNFHADPDQKKQFFCDYPKCTRSLEPFTRKDHWRDHLKEFHQEDLGCAKGLNSRKGGKGGKEWEREQEKWLRERKVDARWWRCKHCLERVEVRSEGWWCKRCTTECESERREMRMTRGGQMKVESVNMVDEDMEIIECAEEAHYTTSPLHACSTCDGSGYINLGMRGWDRCQRCHPPAQISYTKRPYNNGVDNATWPR